MHLYLSAVAPILARQHSLITVRQSLHAGGTHELHATLVRRGIWERVERGIYGPTGVPDTWRRRLMTAILLAPPGSLISHRAAAACLAVGGFGAGDLAEPDVELTIPRGSSLRRPWITVHESTDLDLADVVILDGIPVTGPRRLAVDLGSVVTPRHLAHAIRQLRHEHGLTSPQLLHCYLRHKARGRNGGGALRDWLDRYFHISGTAESGLEQVVVDALIDAGHDDFVLQHPVDTGSGSFRLDIAFLGWMLDVEVDGAQHDDPDIVASDRRRTRALRRAGWQVERIHSERVATDLGWVLTVLHRLRRSDISSATGRHAG